ncbi:MAG: hypothetical protein RLZZ546_711, partial [Bacteroidota bacterium]
MKLHIFLICAILIFGSTNSSFSQSKSFSSKIDRISVFRQGAQIKRKALINLIAGQNEVIVTDLPAGFDEASIQISLKDKSIINGVSYQNNFTKNLNNNPEYKMMFTQKENLSSQLENENLIYETWKEEESLLISNKKVNGDESGLNTSQLTALADVYRTRLLEVKTKALDSKRKIQKLKSELDKIDAQLNEWTAKNSNPNTGEIIVSILNNLGSIETIMEISYFDPRASWQTSFDLRLENLQKPLLLTNKGKIAQYTGEDWKDININLSTGNPTQYTSAPILQPWFLQYLAQDYYYAYGAKRKESEALNTANFRPKAENDGVFEPSEIRENITFTEYSLSNKTSVPSDGKEHEVTLNENEVDASYQYISIPKLDNKVYLIANIKDWDQYNFSSGAVKLYFEGTYVGNTFLNAGLASDTLTLSLGPDIAINAKREKLKDFSKTSFLSTKKEIKSGFEITIKNNKPSAIEVVLKDQIPIATDASMEVKEEELSGGKYDKTTGIIEWLIK